jgi:cytoskeletal protein CcmA (bactofilin family)
MQMNKESAVRISALLVAITGIMLVAQTPASAQIDTIWRAGARVNVVASDHRDVWAAGAIVSVRGTVLNEVWAAGAEVDVDAIANGDMWAAGAIASVKGGSAKNLYVVGARVSIDARVGGKLSAAGARVIVGPRTEVRGDTRLAGADIVFAGTSGGPVTLYGDSVQIDGRIAGDLHVRARSVTVGKGAVIDGSALFETLNEPLIEEGATLRGRQTVTLPKPRKIEGEQIVGVLVAIILFGVGAGFVLGLILLIVARGFVERTIDLMRLGPGRSVLVGVGVLILVPLAAIAVMATVIGIPVGLVALLAFPLLLFTGSVLGAFGLSDWVLNRGREERSFIGRIALLLAGLLALTVIGLIPVLGFLTWLLAVTLGLGAFWQAFRSPRPVGTAVA